MFQVQKQSSSESLARPRQTERLPAARHLASSNVGTVTDLIDRERSLNQIAFICSRVYDLIAQTSVIRRAEGIHGEITHLPGVPAHGQHLDKRLTLFVRIIQHQFLV